MRERTSSGTRLMRTKEFFHSRMIASAVVVSPSSRETACKENLERKSGTIPGVLKREQHVLDLRRAERGALQLLVQSKDKL